MQTLVNRNPALTGAKRESLLEPVVVAVEALEDFVLRAYGFFIRRVARREAGFEF